MQVAWCLKLFSFTERYTEPTICVLTALGMHTQDMINWQRAQVPKTAWVSHCVMASKPSTFDESDMIGNINGSPNIP